jgi:hypothetical protein
MERRFFGAPLWIGAFRPPAFIDTFPELPKDTLPLSRGDRRVTDARYTPCAVELLPIATASDIDSTVQVGQTDYYAARHLAITSV